MKITRSAEKERYRGTSVEDLTSNRYNKRHSLPAIIIKYTKKNLNTTKPSLINIANTSCQSLGRFSSDSTAFVKCLFRNQLLGFSALHTNVNESIIILHSDEERNHGAGPKSAWLYVVKREWFSLFIVTFTRGTLVLQDQVQLLPSISCLTIEWLIRMRASC